MSKAVKLSRRSTIARMVRSRWPRPRLMSLSVDPAAAVASTLKAREPSRNFCGVENGPGRSLSLVQPKPLSQQKQNEEDRDWHQGPHDLDHVPPPLLAFSGSSFILRTPGNGEEEAPPFLTGLLRLQFLYIRETGAPALSRRRVRLSQGRGVTSGPKD